MSRSHLDLQGEISDRETFGDSGGNLGAGPESLLGRREVPLSEEEQRILHEMERKLYEHDRPFADRVRVDSPKSLAHRTTRWSVAIFVAGLLVLLFSFRSSLLLGTFGFLVMLFAAILFERGARQTYVGRTSPEGTEQPQAGSPRAKALSDELSLIGRRFRSRFLRDR